MEDKPLIDLPEGARWHASVKLDEKHDLFIASLKYPRWDFSFYPFILEKGKPLFEFPKDLQAAADDGRRWQSCPKQIQYNSNTMEIVVDTYISSESPASAVSERQVGRAPDFRFKIAESLRDPEYAPTLSKLLSEFKTMNLVFYK